MTTAHGEAFQRTTIVVVQNTRPSSLTSRGRMHARARHNTGDHHVGSAAAHVRIAGRTRYRARVVAFRRAMGLCDENTLVRHATSTAEASSVATYASTLGLTNRDRPCARHKDRARLMGTARNARDTSSDDDSTRVTTAAVEDTPLVEFSCREIQTRKPFGSIPASVGPRVTRASGDVHTYVQTIGWSRRGAKAYPSASGSRRHSHRISFDFVPGLRYPETTIPTQ